MKYTWQEELDRCEVEKQILWMENQLAQNTAQQYVLHSKNKIITIIGMDIFTVK